MTKNVGIWDKVLRVVGGGGLIAWAVTSGHHWGYLGFIPLLTALVGWCPLYTPFGISTCRRK